MFDLFHGAMQVLAQVGEVASTTQAAAAAAPAGSTAATITQSSCILHFVEQSDLVGKSLFGIVLLMSLSSWYLIFSKSLLNLRIRHRSEKFLVEV